RHMIAWPERIRREAPLLERVLRDGPSNRILDLGSGPGDHARWLASIGFDVVGVDSSESMLRMAAQEPVPANVRFVMGDFRDLPAVVDATFGGAICLGNALPHLTEESDLRALASGLAAKLETGAKAVFQMLNYDRIAATGERALPVNVRDDPDGEGELVFVRVMTLPDAERRVRFYPTALRLDPESEEPMEVVSTRRVELRAWTRADLARLFGEHGLVEDEVLGAFDGAPFDEKSSKDLIWVGRR
ncbi:MAG: class I SAM-dependent methyltransferase, partial [Thermoanaerobaculia bacterium]